MHEGPSACHLPCCRGDLVQIETYFSAEGRVGARRDWVIRSAASGEVLGRATRSAPVVSSLVSDCMPGPSDKQAQQVMICLRVAT